MNRTPSPAPWPGGSSQNWQDLERQAAAQAREYYSRRPPQPPPEPPRPPVPAPQEMPRQKLLGRFSTDQLLLAALLCLLVQEEADPALILAVAYILLA